MPNQIQAKSRNFKLPQISYMYMLDMIHLHAVFHPILNFMCFYTRNICPLMKNAKIKLDQIFPSMYTVFSQFLCCLHAHATGISSDGVAVLRSITYSK